MKVYPTPPDSIGMLPISPVVPFWQPSGWIEIFSNTEAELHIAGMSFDFAPRTQAPLEIEFGVGAIGEEETIHVYRAEIYHATNAQNHWIWFEIPLGNIPADVRLAVRFCSEQISTPTARFNIMYFENFSTDHKSSAPASCFPYRADSFSVTWNTSLWQNTAWIEITPGEENEICFTSIHYQPSNYDFAAEIDLAMGPVGSEHAHIMFTKRFWNAGGGSLTKTIHFAGAFPVYPLNRVSFRIRKNSVVVSTAIKFSFNIIRNTVFLS
jgi:hypothetical protein